MLLGETQMRVPIFVHFQQSYLTGVAIRFVDGGNRNGEYMGTKAGGP